MCSLPFTIIRLDWLRSYSTWSIAYLPPFDLLVYFSSTWVYLNARSKSSSLASRLASFCILVLTCGDIFPMITPNKIINLLFTFSNAVSKCLIIPNKSRSGQSRLSIGGWSSKETLRHFIIKLIYIYLMLISSWRSIHWRSNSPRFVRTYVLKSVQTQSGL